MKRIAVYMAGTGMALMLAALNLAAWQIGTPQLGFRVVVTGITLTAVGMALVLYYEEYP